MIINCCQISEGPQLVGCEYNAAIDAMKHRNGRIWIDVQGAEKSELEEKLDDLNVNGLIRSFCLESNDHPGFYPLQPQSLLVIPVYTEMTDSRKLEYMGFLYSPDFLLTFRDKELVRFQKNLTLSEYTALLPDASIAGLIASFALGFSLVALRKAAFLEDSILLLEEKMDRVPDTDDIEELSAKRLEMLSIESVVRGQLPITQALLTSDRASVSIENTQDYLIWASANLQSADRTLEWLERRVEEMRSSFDAYAQNRINRRLGRLTVLSTIFMPITFMAGIWGMNFEFMPGLGFRYGYVMALAAMFLIGGGMYLSFRRMGWFD